MANRFVSSSAVCGLCVMVATGAAMAQTQYYGSTMPPGHPQHRQAYQYAAAPIGTYHSDAFFPSPLTLTITGMDRSGNLSGSIGGMRSSFVTGETIEKWENWQRTFGRDSRATYREGKITITFPNGASYVLDNRGSELVGSFIAKNENRAISFRRGDSVAGRY